MKLEMNEVSHKYILRMIIFALFLYKRQIKQSNVYKNSVNAFLKKRIPWKINLHIDLDNGLSKENERDLILDELLNGVKTTHRKVVNIIFTSPLKNDCYMQIDLSSEEKYTNFLYN